MTGSLAVTSQIPKRAARQRQSGRQPLVRLGPPLRPARTVHASGTVPLALRRRPVHRRNRVRRRRARRVPRPAPRGGRARPTRSSSSPPITASRSANTANGRTACSPTTRRCACRSSSGPRRRFVPAVFSDADAARRRRADRARSRRRAPLRAPTAAACGRSSPANGRSTIRTRISKR